MDYRGYSIKKRLIGSTWKIEATRPDPTGNERIVLFLEPIKTGQGAATSSFADEQGKASVDRAYAKAAEQLLLTSGNPLA